jgi:hypothetical protein
MKLRAVLDHRAWLGDSQSLQFWGEYEDYPPDIYVYVWSPREWASVWDIAKKVHGEGKAR